MAELQIEDSELALHLSTAEKVGAVHGDLRVPLSAVRRVEILADAHEPADHGIKLGTRIPGGYGSSLTGRSTTRGSSAATTRSR
jgi:hypothetical protein